MRPGPVVADPARLGGLHLDDYTFRSAALGHALRFDPAAGPKIPGHGGTPAAGRLSPLARSGARTVTLAILSPSDEPALAALVAALRPRVAGVVVVADPRPDDAALAHAQRLGADVIVRPLTDFAQSRNAANARAATPWVFHLDTDETLPAVLFDRLDALAALAGDAGIDAVGFPRQNLVDGVPSDLFPDLQYRLVRRTVPFEGRVHERPAACRDWPRTMTAPLGAIRHALDAGRIAARNARYEAMNQHPDRAAEAAALLTPFRP